MILLLVIIVGGDADILLLTLAVQLLLVEGLGRGEFLALESERAG